MSSTYVRADDTADLFDDTESTNGKPTIHVHQKIPNSTFRLFFDAAHRYACDGKRQLVWKCVFAILLFLTGMLLGFAIKRAMDRFSSPCYSYTTIDYNTNLMDSIDIQPLYIADVVNEVAKTSHLAGTPENAAVYSYIGKKLNEMNVNWRPYTYSVALTHQQTISNFYIRDSKNEKKYTCQSCVATDGIAPFIAYSANAQFRSADVMYVNYGREEDFAAMDDAAKAVNKTFSCSARNSEDYDGLVVVARQSPHFPLSDIVKTISKYCRTESTKVAIDGVNVAVLFYADPADWRPDWNELAGNVAGAEFNGKTAQFGDARGDTGDPDTPYLPSIDNVMREPMDNDAEVPEIAVMPIGYDDARQLLIGLGGPAIRSFQGGLSDVYYGTGPGYSASAPNGRSDWRVFVNIDTRQSASNVDAKSNITNIIATFEGELEPDRYVIIGTHYDGLPIGAADSAGGVGVLLAIAKGLRSLQQAGRWRPRRTVILAFWDGEEFGAIGSTEFVEQFGTEIAARTVAYINVDTPVLGTYTFYSRMHPLIAGVLFNATTRVRIDLGFGEAKGPSVYERWCARAPFNTELNEPDIIPPGSETDVTAFSSLRGIPFLFPQYRGIPPNGSRSGDAWPSRVNWPMEHTVGDTPTTLQRVMDMGLAYHAVMARILSDTVFRLADSVFLPYDPVRFARWLQLRFEEKLGARQQELLQAGCGFPFITDIRELLRQMVVSAGDYLRTRSKVDKNNLFALRRENDRMMMLVEAFETDYNFEYRRSYSLLFEYTNGYHDSPMYFPGVSRALQEYKSMYKEANVNCRREMSALMLAVRTANRILQDDMLDDLP